MRRLVMMLAATGLLMCAAPYARTESTGDAANTEVLDKAKIAEVKGDVARIHKDYAGAVSDYSTALRISRDDAGLYNKLGIAELQLGEKGAANKAFGKALRLDPQLTAAMNNLGAVNLMQKRYKVAVVYFKRALAMDESSAPTHLNLAESWFGLGETDRAMTEYARALELDADILSSSQDGVIAQVTTPEQRARVFYMIAKSYLKRGNPDGALDYLQRAKELRYPDLGKVYSDPDFMALWQDPRLAKIVKR
ncbi:MAG: tetratricopeptide repeat protein [Terracidiphilus sp.]|jgi:tetratricopeptide (TPR) repeat protein